MNFLDRLEKHFGWMAIGHLPIYIVTAQAIIWLWVLLNPESEALLTLEPWAIHNGEYWRFVTFLFLVPFTNPIFAFFYLYFQYICGISLEEEWGSFRLTLFYLVGAISAIGAAFLVGGNAEGASYLNETVFLAFAALNPNFSILLFFILPVKIKWIAWFTWARILFGLYRSPVAWKIAILLSLSNYVIFFSKKHYEQVRDMVQRWRHHQRYKQDFPG